jgi:hypothetical protein
MASGGVHRDLRLQEPFMKGPDVEALQEALNKIAKRFPRLADFKLDEDEKLGKETLNAAFKAAYIMGLARPRLNEIEKEQRIAQPVQVILRHPGTRNDEERKRAEDRRNALRKKLRRRGSLRAVRVSVSPGDPHWGGSNDLMEQFVEPFMLKRGLRPGSGKRTPKENKAIGGDPDSLHLTTKTTGFGRDFPTFAGEDDARALATSVGFEGWQPNSFAHCTFSAGGRVWDAQILWGARIKHGDHVHVGIRPA